MEWKTRKKLLNKVIQERKNDAIAHYSGSPWEFAKMAKSACQAWLSFKDFRLSTGLSGLFIGEKIVTEFKHMRDENPYCEVKLEDFVKRTLEIIEESTKLLV